VAAVIGTEQERFEPRQAPLHARSFHPFAGLAVSRTGLNDGNVAEHFGLQAIPVRALRTTPLPATRTVSGKAAGAKRAESSTPDVTVTVHPAAPWHAEPQRTSLEPGPGVAVNARRVPPFQVVVQLCAQSRPGTSAETDPWPDTTNASGTWLSTRTSHGESCASGHAPL